MLTDYGNTIFALLQVLYSWGEKHLELYPGLIFV